MLFVKKVLPDDVNVTPEDVGEIHVCRVFHFQVRHPRCVERIASIDKCSQTQLLIFVLPRGVSM